MASVLAIISSASAANAQSTAGTAVPTESTLEDIVVTATKTGATRLQETPIAITAFSAEGMERSGAKDVRDLVGLTPSLQIAENTGQSQIYIRGIGSNNSFAGSDPSTTVHLDGIYLARPGSYFANFLDVERVEVLRGPQGTLYGRNSVGGTINIISRKPNNETRAKVQLTAGNYDLYRGEGFISGPVIEDKLAAGISALYSNRAGYQRNIAPSGSPRIDSEDVASVRGQIRFTPSPAVDITLRADYTNASQVPGGYMKTLVRTQAQVSPLARDPLADSILGNYRLVALNTPEVSGNRNYGYAADISLDLSSNLTLTSLTSYRNNHFTYTIDSDASAALVRRTDQDERQNQTSEEVNLRGKLSFVIGGYYFKENIATSLKVTNFIPMLQINPNISVHARALAGYAQGTYKLSPILSVTAGLRYTDEEKNFGQRYLIRTVTATSPLAVGAARATDPIVFNKTGKYKAWTPKFEIDVKPIRNVLIYASATRGFKSGGFNITSANPAQGFNPEYLWSYELGVKADLFDRMLRVNGAVFHYQYKDLQVQAFITPGVTDITNAANAKINGAELEVTAKPVSSLELGGTLSLLDATYSRYLAAPVGTTTVDASGNRLNSSPEWSYSLFGQFTANLDGDRSLFVRGEYARKGRQFFTPDNNSIQTQGSYSLLNASVGVTGKNGKWQVVAFGRNLADTQYVTTTALFTGAISGRVGEPRTYGLRLVFNY